MKYAHPNLTSRAVRLGFSPFFPAGRVRLDGLGAYYPVQLYYRDGTPVDRRVRGMGDICTCPVLSTLRGLRGLGQQQITGETIAISATSMAGSTAGFLASQGILLSSAAIPIIGIAVAGVTVAITLLWHAFNHDPRKNATTSIVNQIEPKLQENLAAYMAGPRTFSSQAQALANFDAGWNLVLANCDRQEFGTAAGEPGYNCIHDRMEGACHWTKDGKTPGVPPDNCWNWFIGYRDVIAADPNVKPDPDLTATVKNSLDTSGAPVGTPNYLLLAGLLAGTALLTGAYS